MTTNVRQSPCSRSHSPNVRGAIVTITRVYQYGCLRPVLNEKLVREQIRAGHDYANELIAIERGRRGAIREVTQHATMDLTEAEELVRASTRSTRKAAKDALYQARKQAREMVRDELTRIEELDRSICRDARALTPAWWGTYLTVEQSHEQIRKMPLYDSEKMTEPNDPSFRRARVDRFYSDDVLDRAVGQIGVQLQGGISTEEALSCTDTRIRLEMSNHPKYGTLWMRIGSENRAPIWTKIPIKLHRPVPAGAIWKWVRLSCRREGLRERWSVEITLSMEAPKVELPPEERVIAVDFTWDARGDAIRVGTWADAQGETGEIILPDRICTGIRKPDGIRSVRDQLLNDLRPRLVLALAECKEELPGWLIQARSTISFWKSHERFRELARKWRGLKCDAAREAYDVLQEWELRDNHLYDYESGARGEALRERREFYRLLAKGWSRKYRTILIPKRNLSFAARFGAESDLRFTACPSEFAASIRMMFPDRVFADTWYPDNDAEKPPWIRFAIERWNRGETLGISRTLETMENQDGRWKKRKERKEEEKGCADRSQTGG